MLKFQNKPDFFDKPLSCTFKHIESHSLGPPKVWQEGGLQERDPETGTWCWDQISTAKWCKSAWERSRVRGGQVLQVHSMSRTGLPWEKGLVVYSLHGWRKKHIYIYSLQIPHWMNTNSEFHFFDLPTNGPGVFGQESQDPWSSMCSAFSLGFLAPFPSLKQKHKVISAEPEAFTEELWPPKFSRPGMEDLL